jgi:hypothetical protein
VAEARPWTKVLVTASVMAAGLVGLTPTAGADNPLCPANTICVYKHANYSGGRYTYPPVLHGYDRLSVHRYDTGSSVDNSISSVINNTDFRIELRANWYIPCTGPFFWVLPHTEVGDLSQHSTLPPEKIVNANDMASCATVQQ